MGGCHSACGSRAYELEYYNEAYRHQVRKCVQLSTKSSSWLIVITSLAALVLSIKTRQRAHAKLVDESLAIGGRRLRDKHRAMRRLSGGGSGSGRPTRLWMCEQGCCSIRWKLDYAEFQSYTVYAQVSPYVVVQDKTGQCECVICRGTTESLSVSEGGAGTDGRRSTSRRRETSVPSVLCKVYEACRIDADGPKELPSGPTPASSPPLVSETSTADTDDDDDGDDDRSV